MRFRFLFWRGNGRVNAKIAAAGEKGAGRKRARVVSHCLCFCSRLIFQAASAAGYFFQGAKHTWGLRRHDQRLGGLNFGRSGHPSTRRQDLAGSPLRRDRPAAPVLHPQDAPSDPPLLDLTPSWEPIQQPSEPLQIPRGLGRAAEHGDVSGPDGPACCANATTRPWTTH